MKTAVEREAAFRADLAALLEKHGAEMSIGDDGKAYGMHSAICEISMNPTWDDEGNTLIEGADFTL